MLEVALVRISVEGRPGARGERARHYGRRGLDVRGLRQEAVHRAALVDDPWLGDPRVSGGSLA